MKSVLIAIAVLGLAFATTPSLAQGATSLTLISHTEGGSGYFVQEGQTARNPTIQVAPGATVTVTLKAADDGFHNLCVGNDDTCTEYVQAPGDTYSVMFTAPETGTIEYYCVPHKAAGMKGTFTTQSVATTPAGNGGGETKDSPGLGAIGVLVALVGALLLVRRRN